MQDYRKLAFAGFRDDDTEEDKEYVLAELIERNVPATPELVNALLEQRREFKARAILASQIDSSRQMEIVEDLERQYPMMKEALERFGFSMDRIPSWSKNWGYWSEIRSRLEPKVLIPAQNMMRPTLLLIPPCFNGEMVRMIDRHRLTGQKKCVYPGSWRGWLLSDFFGKNWDDKPRNISDMWGVAIAEGEPDIDQDPKISGYNWDRFCRWQEKLHGQGLDVMDTACAWLTLWIASIHKGKPVDQYAPNALKTPVTGRFTGLVTVRWTGNRIEFQEIPEFENWPSLHGRGIVWIVKPH